MCQSSPSCQQHPSYAFGNVCLTPHLSATPYVLKRNSCVTSSSPSVRPFSSLVQEIIYTNFIWSKAWAPFQNRNRLSQYSSFHCKNKGVFSIIEIPVVKHSFYTETSLFPIVVFFICLFVCLFVLFLNQSHLFHKNKDVTIVLFHNNFPPSGEQPEHRELADEL